MKIALTLLTAGMLAGCSTAGYKSQTTHEERTYSPYFPYALMEDLYGYPTNMWPSLTEIVGGELALQTIAAATNVVLIDTDLSELPESIDPRERRFAAYFPIASSSQPLDAEASNKIRSALLNYLSYGAPSLCPAPPSVCIRFIDEPHWVDAALDFGECATVQFFSDGTRVEVNSGCAPWVLFLVEQMVKANLPTFHDDNRM